MGKQGGIKGWEKEDNPPSEYLERWSTYPTDNEIRTEKQRRSFPIFVRVWEEREDGYAVETERGDMDRDELHASRQTWDSEEEAKKDAKTRMRRINEDSRFFGGYMSENDIDEAISSIRHSSRNNRQLGNRLKELGKKIKQGSKKRERERNSRV